MDGISLSWRLLPQALIERYALEQRAIMRGADADREFRFLYRDARPLLPVWMEGQLKICNWGRPPRRSRLPRSAAVAQEAIQAGEWQALRPIPVEIPANFGWDKGVWYRIREGVRGVLVRDEQGQPIVFLLTEPASHYYQVMTRNRRMPVLCGERI